MNALNFGRSVVTYFANGLAFDAEEYAALYRVAHGLAPDAAVDVAAVEAWARKVGGAVDLGGHSRPPPMPT